MSEATKKFTLITNEKPDNNTQMKMIEEERTICFCHNVCQAKIVEAIRAGADTVEKLQEETQASTGCGGCEFDLQEILDEEKTKNLKKGVS